MTNLEALIVDPNPTTRNYLWQAILATTDFHGVKSASSPKNTIDMLTQGKKFDVIILSSQFDQQTVRDFISEARRTTSGRECAFITVIKQTNDRGKSVATGMIDGSDGFLMEPFSTTSLRQVAEIATRVKKEAQEARVKAGLNMLFQDIIPVVDRYAETKRQGGDTKQVKKELIGLSENLKKVGKNYFRQMIDVAIDSFSAAAPRILIQRKVSNPADRMQMLMERKLKAASKIEK